MDWFFALEAPTQVAIVGVITATVVGLGSVVVAIINNRRQGGGKAEIAAMTMDASAVRQVAAAIEALNVSILEQNRLTADGGGEAVDAIRAFTREVEELRREVRALSDKMRGRG